MFDDNGSFLLALFEFFIFFAWFMCLWWIFGDLFRSRDLGGVAKTFWALFIIVLPILGMLVYLIARGNGMTERGSRPRPRRRSGRTRTSGRSRRRTDGKASAADEIASAKSLLDSGAINQSEFEQLKAKALATSGT